MQWPGVKLQFCERTSRPDTPLVPGEASTKAGLKDCGHAVLLSRKEMTGVEGRDSTVTL